MFDNYVWSDGKLEAVKDGDKIIGYNIRTLITYYRGVPLSMIHDLQVIVDGVNIPKEELKFSPNGEDWFVVPEMETVTTYKWEYGDEGIIFFPYVGGLPEGNHTITVKQVTRVAYIPVPFSGERTRTITM